MASVNKVILIGNLGRDPELRYNANGGAWCTVAIATSRNWKNKDTGERQEETEWHRVVFNDRLAEIAGEYLKKGRPVYVEGRLKTRKWTDKDGIEKYTTEIQADQMQLLGGREEGGGGGGGGGGSASRGSSSRSSSSSSNNDDHGNYGEPEAARAEAPRRATSPTPPAPAPAPRAPTPKSSTGFDDMDDDIPF